MLFRSVTADWNRIVFILSNAERPGEDALGTLYVTVSNEVNQAPVIGTPKYDYNAQTGNAVVTMQSEVLDLATLSGLDIRDPEGKAWQLVEVQSYSATVIPVDPQSVSNTGFTFTAATIGSHIVSYIVGDHEGGFAAGLISIRVGPRERAKDWVDTTIDKFTYYATPLYSETFNKGVIAAEGVWDSGVNLASTPPGNTIAGLTGAQARAYCNANGIRLADQANLDLFRTTASADGVRNLYPQQRSYLISNDGGSSFRTYNLTSGATAPYQPGTTANQYVICVKYADDGKMAYFPTPNTPMAGYTNTAISDGQWWSLGNVVSDGGVSGIKIFDSVDAGEGTLSEANFRLSPLGCAGGTCELQANASEQEFGAVSLQLTGSSNDLYIAPVTFWQNATLAGARPDVNIAPADGVSPNSVKVSLHDKDGQPVPSGTKVKLTYSTNPSSGVVMIPASQPGGTTFTADSRGEVAIAITYNNPTGGDVAVTINPVVWGIPSPSQSVTATFTPLGPDFGAGCSQGLVTAGSLTYTCPLTQAVADANGISYTATSSMNGFVYVRHNFASANAYCTGLGGGYRLPTKAELRALYDAHGDMETYAGWPTSGAAYWTSTGVDFGAYYVINLLSGGAYSAPPSYNEFATCVR